MAEIIKKTKPRKANARSTQTVIECIEERLNCIIIDDYNQAHLNRMAELLNELRRSLNGKKGSK